jgi:N6-L-threonylcarbamoyladenine synthase
MKVKGIMASTLYTSCCMLLWNARSIRSLTTTSRGVCSHTRNSAPLRVTLLQSRVRVSGRRPEMRLWSSQSTDAADTTDSSSTTPIITPETTATVTPYVDIAALEKAETEKAARKAKAKEKRKKFIGLAKAVDRGQFAVTYCPGGTAALTDGAMNSFQALSGLPDRSKPFTVLGIESSCDDTGAAVVRSDGVLLGEALASQHDIHEEWGGVVPGLARDEHVAQIDRVVEMALKQAGMTSAAEVDAISVTVGPGLEICLRVGCTKAVELALQYNKPFVGIHHLEAHILMARLPLLGDDSQSSLVQIPATADTHESVRTMDFPFLALLVSGGHCQLMKCLGIGNYEIIGGTLDDSLGEAFDKTARMLGLLTGGGGGPAVEKLALQGDPKAVELPIPLQKRKDCDFSYAGLKTAVRKAAEKLAAERGVATTEELPLADKANIAASFQNVAIRHIEMRLNRAMDLLEPEGIRTLALVGGVAANTELRTRLQAVCAKRGRNVPPEEEPQPWTMLVPPPRLCTDQGSMSAWAGVERIMVGSSDDPNIQEVHARYPFSSNISTSPPSS